MTEDIAGRPGMPGHLHYDLEWMSIAQTWRSPVKERALRVPGENFRAADKAGSLKRELERAGEPIGWPIADCRYGS